MFLRLLTVVFIAACVLLPSGSIFLINVKVISAAVIVSTLLYTSMLHGRVSKRGLTFICFLLLFLIYTLVVSVINQIPQYSIESELSALIATLLPVLIGIYVCRNKVIALSSIIRIIIFIVVIHAIIRLTVFSAFYFGILSPTDYLTFINKVFGVQIISLEIGKFVRLNSPSDYLFPLTIYWLTSNLAHNRRFLYLISLLALFITVGAVVITYSRYLWLFGITAFVCGLYVTAKRRRHGSALTYFNTIRGAVAMVFGGAIVGLVILFYGETISEFVLNRYIGGYAIDSDMYRKEMFDAILPLIERSPIFGMGVGAYAPNLIRFPQSPWNYELQWMAFTMQFGVVGIFCIILILAWFLLWGTDIVRDYRITTFAFGWGVLFILWIITGIFNSFLLTSSAGVVFLLFWCTAAYNRNSTQTNIINSFGHQ